MQPQSWKKRAHQRCDPGGSTLEAHSFQGPGLVPKPVLQAVASLRLKGAIEQDTAHFLIQEKNLSIPSTAMANNAKKVFPSLSSICRGQAGDLEGSDEGFLEELQGKNVQGLARTERVLVLQG